jgi:uncharacterized C2H2 Zn-finger protein
VCNQSFGDKGTLKSHRVIFSEEHPFVCGACKRAFKRRKDLNKHISLCCV